MNYKYSFIIPVYNVEKYLDECITSILNQTYKNYELILVDDGSTDSSPKLCDKYKKEHKCIKVIHKNNGGLSSARNEGLKHATGDYIVFLDSDDYWIDKDNLININQKIENDDADVLILKVAKFYDGETLRRNQNGQEKKYTISEMIEKNIYKASATDKVISNKIILNGNMKFTNDLLSEDIEWCYKILKFNPKISYLNKEVYAYRQRKGSITRSKNKKHICDILNQCEIALKESYDDNDLKRIILSFYAYEYCTAIGLYSINFFNDKEIKNKILLNKELLKYNLSKKVKIVHFIFKYFGNRISFFILKLFMMTKGI